MQVGGREQVLEGYGWTMLPGLYPTGKALELDVSYKVFLKLLRGCKKVALANVGCPHLDGDAAGLHPSETVQCWNAIVSQSEQLNYIAVSATLLSCIVCPCASKVLQQPTCACLAIEPSLIAYRRYAIEHGGLLCQPAAASMMPAARHESY